MGSHLQPETAETDRDFNICHIIHKYGICTSHEIVDRSGLTLVTVSYRIKILKKYGIMQGDSTGYKPGPEFNEYMAFYADRYGVRL